MDPLAPPAWRDVIEARQRIAPHVHRTPVMTSRHMDALSGARLFFKCENFQRTGAFKARGAANAVFSLDDRRAAAGVATHSSGNHGQAIAYAAGRRGIPATVVVPANASEAKKAAIRGYGARLVECEPGIPAREATLAAVVAETGAEPVHPFNDARVIAGQASAAAELVEEVEDLDIVLAPISGGGLISGTCLAAEALGGGRIRVVAAEPANADDAYRSLRSGTLVTEDAPQTIADGLRASMKELTWQIVSRQVDDVVLASEEEIIAAMRLTWQRMKIVIEPSSAVALAAILANAPRFAGKRVGVIVSGGNVDLDRLPW